jgi:hypothetical protein
MGEAGASSGGPSSEVPLAPEPSAEVVRALMAEIARLKAEAEEKEAKGGKGSSEGNEEGQ